MRLGCPSLAPASVIAAAALAAVLSQGTLAVAQTDDQRAGARAAANAGGQAFLDHKFPEAIDMFTRAESLVHSPVHLLYLARSYEKLGQLVKARETYIKITNEELPPKPSAPIKEARANAEKEQEALEPRVPYVTVVLQGAGAKPVNVSMDGQAVPAALVGVPRPVDPGDHRFDATSEGMDNATGAVSVKEGKSETVTLVLRPSAYVAPVAGPMQPPVGYAQPGYGPPPGSPGQPDKASHGPSPFTWVAFGVGAVGLGVGTVFALQAASKVSDGNKLCGRVGPGGTSDWCDPQVKTLDDDARSANTISVVGFVVGGVGVAAGVTLLLTTSKHTQTQAFTAPYLAPGGAGVRGRF